MDDIQQVRSDLYDIYLGFVTHMTRMQRVVERFGEDIEELRKTFLYIAEKTNENETIVGFMVDIGFTVQEIGETVMDICDDVMAINDRVKGIK